jgi:molecular chaperone GrpE (heat shock protein)
VPATPPAAEEEHVPAPAEGLTVRGSESPRSESAPPPSATETRSDSRTDEERIRDALRDLEAAKQRVERDARRVEAETRAQLVSKLFPMLDSLDRAIASESTETPLLEGVRVLRAQLEAALLEYGVERIESVGRRFDPTWHEAVGVVGVSSSDDDGMVMQEWSAGYRCDGRLLRPAKVAVGKLG